MYRDKAAQSVLVIGRDTTFLMINLHQVDSTTPVVAIGDELDTFIHIYCREECRSKYSTRDLKNWLSADVKGRFIMNLADPIPVSGGCLPDQIEKGRLEIFPRTVGMFGGEMLQVSGHCKSKGSKLYCRYGEGIITTGVMVNKYKGHCPVPLMYRIGPVSVSMSFDNQSWSSDIIIMVVHPENVDVSRSISPEDKKQWYSRDAEDITISWNKSLLSSNSEVQVKLLSCAESANSVTCETLKIFQTTHVDEENLKIKVSKHRCKSDCKKHRFGLFEIASQGENFDEKDNTKRVAIRYGPVPLGWFVNVAMKEDMGDRWSDKLCQEWNDMDSRNEEWTKNLPSCPCNIKQALADFGRFQIDKYNNMYTKIKDLRQNVDHQCVISTLDLHQSESPGSQCCYDKGGSLVYSQLSYHGSISDRSHSKLGRVPLLSHWLQDVMSRYYCCLWNENHLCHKYVSLRPTADCQNYSSPGFAFIRGNSHITTFDGQTYTIVGNGFFWLVNIEKEVKIQGEFSSLPDTLEIGKLLDTSHSSWKPIALVSLAVKVVKYNQTISINPSPYGLNVQVDRDHFMFLDESSFQQDFKGFSIVNNAGHSGKSDNLTVRLHNGIGINVHAANSLLHLIVSLPRNFTSRNGMGLLGNFDDKVDNDFTSRSQEIINAKSDKLQIHKDFIMSWNVLSEDSLFHHVIKRESLIENFKYFEFKDLPEQKQTISANQSENVLCGDSDRCKYDLRVTGKWEIAKMTLAADTAFYSLKSSAKEIDDCGMPKIGLLANLSSNNFSVGQRISVLGCDKNVRTVGEFKTYSCIRESLDEAKEKGQDDYGSIRKDPKNKEEYFIHWVPRPSEVCSDDEVLTSSIGIYIGIAIGILALLICIIITIVLLVKYCPKKNSSTEHTVSVTREMRFKMEDTPGSVQKRQHHDITTSDG
ncbi:hypothetical protein Btru_019847 [Bulinus truncatus]|nr:hypothetical protein Btru_019847 [Bulinus truncatus]